MIERPSGAVNRQPLPASPAALPPVPLALVLTEMP
jgi:hypothetical protein